MTSWRRLAVLAIVAWTLGAGSAAAQYFGRNKVQYRTFNFEILKTEHFDLYFYKEEAEAARIAGRMAERWHARLSRFFGHELRGRQPLILYAASAHFRQTNAVEGLIGEGTGGVTEAMKRRIVLPMSGSLADTDHVLGHELVHAFQFDLTGEDPRETVTQAPGILQFPLWFVEGMAEYLSIGAVDAQTAMWLRDAALREQLPHIKDLDDPKYFPYRWGHAFWAFIGAKYGDRAVASLIRSAANPRSDLTGLARQLGTTPDALTAEWHEAIRQSTRAVAAEEAAIGSEPRLVIDSHTGGGKYNIGPRLSPDGRLIVFYSERDRFSVDLFLADAATGKIIRRLSQSATDPHFDSLQFLNSTGAWSPDSRSFVVGALRGGRPVLAFLDPSSGRVVRELPLPDLDDALNPAFSPDGRSIVFSGNRGGLVDLYRVTLAAGRVDRLTEDPFADLEPTFTPDGRSVVFVTERYSTDLERLESNGLRLARLDLDTRTVHPISAFPRGRHLSPQVSADGRTVTFIGEPDGISNLYRVSIEGGPVLRLSSFITGVAGITSSSPALSAAPAAGRYAFSVFEDDGHAIYVLDEPQIVSLVAPEANSRAALLPGRASPIGDVQRLLADAGRGLPAASAVAPAMPYSHGLTLDAIGSPTLSAGVSEFGAYAVGGVSALFSDVLGDRMLGVAAQVGGSLADFGGELMYVNRRQRWNWAAAAGVLPYRIGYLTLEQDREAGEVLVTETVQRQTSRGGLAVAAYPFNASTRLEVSGGARALGFTTEARTLVYSATTRNLIERRGVVKSSAPSLYLAETSAALVHDTSFFGATSPVFGSRSRIEIGQSLGSLSYTSILGDWRRYFMPRRPVTLAVRTLHVGRYGLDADSPRIAPLFIGYPELVHGYGYGSFTPAECGGTEGIGQCELFRQLSGSRIAVANVEVRAPLAGLLKGEIEYGRLPLEIAGFFDAGVAWTQDSRPEFSGGTQRLMRSAGAAARVNVIGLFVLEVAASRPFDRPNHSWRFQLSLKQGF